MKFQRGGTLLGLVLGVLVGLAVALAVAVYVTKVPVPFVNKGPARNGDQDAAEAKKNKDWDPNAPLYGKNPARPASAPAQPPTGTVGAAATPAASAAKAGTVAKPASTDPLGDLAKAKSAAGAGAVSAAGAVDPFTYFVQAGAFRTPEDAEAQRAKLTLLGVEAKVTEREQSGRTVYRVRVGPFERKEDAEKTKEKLDAAGNETALVRIQR